MSLIPWTLVLLWHKMSVVKKSFQSVCHCEGKSVKGPSLIV